MTDNLTFISKLTICPDLRHEVSEENIDNALGALFVDRAVPFLREAVMNINKLGQFILTSGNKIGPSGDTYREKVIVLVNENTQSSQEYTMIAIQAGLNTKVLGSTTAGADGNMTRFNLLGGLFTSFTGIVYPDGRQTQRIGIIPDILVERTINGVKNGRYELLERAIQELVGLR